MVDTYKNYAKDNPNTVGSALQNQSVSGSLMRAFQSCHVDGFYARLDKIREKLPPDMSDQQKTATALHTLLKTDKHALDFLPNGELGRLMELLTPTDKDGYRMASVDKGLSLDIHKNYKLDEDPYFTRNTMPKYMQLFQEIEKDPMIKNAKKDWAHATESDKVEVAKRIGEIQSSIFGYTPYDVEVHNSRVFRLYKNNTRGIADASRPALDENGQPLNGLIRLNQTELRRKDKDFASFVSTIIHENDHAFQQTTAEKFSNIRYAETEWLEKNKKELGNMTPQEMKSFNTYMRNWADKNLEGGLKNTTNTALLYGGDLRAFGNVMYGAETHYHQATEHSDAGYYETPEEKHAHTISNTAYDYFQSQKWKETTLGNMQDRLDNANTEIKNMKSDLNQYTINTPCNTIPAQQLDGVKWK